MVLTPPSYALLKENSPIALSLSREAGHADVPLCAFLIPYPLLFFASRAVSSFGCEISADVSASSILFCFILFVPFVDS